MDEPVTSQDLVRWSEALAGIARTGLGFTESLYEQERFEEVLAVAADMRVAAGSEYDPADLVQEWMRSVGKGVPGYQTPKVAVGAVVGNDRGEILLVQRADSGVWLYPTGWADIGYSASEVAVKEVGEETGIDCEVVQLLAVLDGLRQRFTRIPLYSLVFHCRATGGELRGPSARDSRRGMVRPRRSAADDRRGSTSGATWPAGQSPAIRSPCTTTSLVPPPGARCTTSSSL